MRTLEWRTRELGNTVGLVRGKLWRRNYSYFPLGVQSVIHCRGRGNWYNTLGGVGYQRRSEPKLIHAKDD